MNYLVTGGAGFIGSHTVELLHAHGHAVRVLDDFSTGVHAHLRALHGSPRLEVVAGDVRDGALVTRLAAGMNGILHLAALVSVQESVTQPERCLDINVRGTCAVLEAARAGGVRRVVLASSAAVYGDNPALPLVEDAGLAPCSPYAQSKHVNELYAALYQRLHGLDATALRYFNVYGPRQDPRSPYSGVISIFVDRLLTGNDLVVYGDGRQTRDFVSVLDVAAANVAALERARRGFRVYNVASGATRDIRELAEQLMRLSGVRVGVRHQPARAGDVQHSRADIGRLRAELGWAPRRDLADGLRELLATMGDGQGTHAVA